MLYKLTHKKSREAKNLVDAATKNAAICYFAAIMHLDERTLLKIYRIR